MRIIDSTHTYTIEICGKHDESSQQNDRSKYLTAVMSGAINTQVRANPLKTATQISKELQISSPTQEVPANKIHLFAFGASKN